MPDLRELIRATTDEPAPTPGIDRVVRRARVLRARRFAVGALAAAVATAAVALPLYGLRHLGHATVHQEVASPELMFGDGSVSFPAAAGWTVAHSADGTFAWATTRPAFEDPDLSGSNSVPNSTIAAQGASDVTLVAWAESGPYGWAQPDSNFKDEPMTLPGVCSSSGAPDGMLKCIVTGWARYRQISVDAFLGSPQTEPSAISSAQEELGSLQVSNPANAGGHIAFAPSPTGPGCVDPCPAWHDYTATPNFGSPAEDLPAAWTSNVALPAYDGSYSPAGPTNQEIANLPPDGIIVSARQILATRNAIPGNLYPSLPPVLHMSDGKVTQGGWEGQADAHITQYYFSGSINGRPIVVQTYFNTLDPGQDLIREAQTALDRLVVVPVAPPEAALDDFGISMQLPSDWWGALFAQGDVTLEATSGPAPKELYYASLTDALGAQDVAIVMQESVALQDLRWPTVSGPPKIGADNLCDGCEVLDGGSPPPAGHVLYRNTFTTGGRAFDLYVEFGSTPSQQQIDQINSVLSTLSLTPKESPEPPPAGGTAVGSLPDGEHAAITSSSSDRTLMWGYTDSSITVPDRWTGWYNFVVDSGEPLNVFAIGSWDFPQGAYCGPITALQQLPSDGMLIWIDRYGAGAAMIGTPWPTSPDVGPGTSPAPATTDCSGGVPVQTFAWTLNGRAFAVHVAFGSQVSGANLNAADSALATFSSGR